MISLIVFAVLIAGLYMAWNIGANDLANAMGTSVGSGALNIKQVIILAGIFELFGAVFFGSHVTKTIAKGIVPIDPIMQSDPHIVVLGALAAILAASFWITFATFYHLPVSTTHSIVGAVMGFGLASVAYGFISISSIRWVVLMKIVASWIISPVLGGILAFVIFSIIRYFLQRSDAPVKFERIFGYLQIVSAGYVAFAHGSNDVGNAVGPLSTALSALNLIDNGQTPTWILVVGGVGIVVGLATWGTRVIKTIGCGITELTPTRGFSAEFATATIVVLHSYSSLPVSTTHVLVGSVIGVGLAGGLASVDLSMIGKIFVSWVMTVPITALTSAIIFMGLMGARI